MVLCSDVDLINDEVTNKSDVDPISQRLCLSYCVSASKQELQTSSMLSWFLANTLKASTELKQQQLNQVFLLALLELIFQS